MSKIIDIKKYQKNQLLKSPKMLFASIIIGLFSGIILWKYFVENIANYDVKIPASNHILFNNYLPLGLTTSDIANKFEQYDGSPILFYLYTTWCGSCSRNFPIINEIADEFQNTDLKIIAIAIDRNLDGEILKKYTEKFGDIYFSSDYLTNKQGFMDFLNKKGIKYRGEIPYTALLSSNGEIVFKHSGIKSKNYLRNKIIKELYPN
jgi:thiol-disulfide isomerase/thioredoxin